MEPSEEIKNLLEEIRDTQREHLALYKKFTQRSRRALAIQRIALVPAFVGLIGLVCWTFWMVYVMYSYFFSRP
jgi:hypothetical protein